MESMSEHSESDCNPVDYYDPGKSFEIETRILSNRKRTVHLPGAEHVMEKDEEHLIPKDPVDRDLPRDLPDVESTNAEKDDHPTPRQPVEESLSGQPEVEVLDESSVVESGREMAQVTDQEQPDANSESPENTNRGDESSTSTQRESTTLKDSQENQSEETETELLRRSSRQCDAPKRLHYPQLGNPLSLVVQSLFSSLSTAITTTLEDLNPHRTYSPVEII
ncbi:uncharacterized protein LOC125280239 [Megalobrama amblycephala]|uniref:uncharacterized protein LOC125280239 n=1 Tax=Megalobrama amblycephala TaxID=75352 RepID=UPI00201458FB|nr:uncharacterized protein LOC125280239 [Megalobrama amblycephala]XP_048066585.1 uncharacterized protein LOC125280239 [Megalobrama amblycephala]